MILRSGLKDCREHGPFRGETCPVCNSEGRMLMNYREIEGVGRVLAGMLRHFPENYGVRLDDHGWIRIYTIVPPIRLQKKQFGWLTPYHIEALALTDPKERYQVSKNHEIRAAYGHTIPIEMDDLPTDDIPPKLYYQTTEEELEFINETGISPSDKTWVHLSLTYRQAYVAGLYHVDSPTIVEVDSEKLIESGRPIYRATSDVFVVKEIPPEFIVVSEPEEVELTESEQKDIETVKERREKRIRREGA